MRVEDWRQAPFALVEPLYEAEARRWRLSLEWDLTATIAQLEQARAAGTLPGYLLRGPGQSVVGWTYFVVQDGTVQIGGLLARTSDGLRLLLDTVLKSAEAAVARDVMLFAFPESVACESALVRRRFDVTRYWYLRRSLGEPRAVADAPASLTLRPLAAADGPDAVRLLARAYDGQEAARCFAPNGRIEEWAYYFAQLTRGQALGVMEPEASLVAQDSGGRVQALAITTAVSPSVLHLAQLVVAPDAQGRRIGGQVLDGTMAWGHAERRRLMTLLVNDDNQVARQLYASRGFMPTGYFLYARRPMLRRTFPTPPSAVVATAAAQPR